MLVSTLKLLSTYYAELIICSKRLESKIATLSVEEHGLVRVKVQVITLTESKK